jgi:hypothetical protein
MKARPHRPSAEDVRGLMAELGELVQDLGLETPTTQAPPPATKAPPAATETALPAAEPAPSAPQGAPAAPPAEAAAPPMQPAAAAPLAAEMRAAMADTAGAVADLETIEAVPMWESAEATPPAPVSWDAVVPRRPDEAPRAWSPAAAMVVIEPAAPPQGHRIRALPATSRVRRPHAFTIVTVLAVVVAAAVFAFSRLDLGRTSGPSQPVSQVSFEVTGMRTVAASSAAGVSRAPSVRRFNSTVPAVYLDITYHNVTASDALRVVILLQPDQGNLVQSTVSDETHTKLDPGGEIAVTVEAPPGGFVPGTYTVRALHDGHLEQTATFQVDQAG